MILGFGCIEEQARKDIIAKLASAPQNGVTWESIEEEYRTLADKYDKMPRDTAPERYTIFWIHPNKVVFMHTNRNYAFSPDGWASITVEEPVLVRQA